MTYQEFEKKYDLPELNAQQISAVTSIDGPVECLAVPGSGKTTILVTRLGYMVLAHGIDPESILTVTYTVAATHDMASRFAQFFGTELAERMQFRTINGICASIINWFCRRVGKTPLRLISEDRQVAAILSGIWKECMGAYPSEMEIKTVRTSITYAKNMMLSEKEIVKMDREIDGFSNIYRSYCRYMRENSLMDYDDQMVYTYNVLKSFPEVLSYYRSSYRYICVDEAQDTSKIQHEILHLLASGSDGNRPAPIFLVGDEDQSIYGFRAAWPEALLQFESRYPGGKVLYMEKNYRSVADIVEAADRFIQKNKLRHPKTMTADRDATGKAITVRDIASRKAQYTYLCNVARKCKEETAILYRDTESAIPLIDLLDTNHIPFSMRSKDPVFFSHKVTQDITNLMKLVLDGKDTEAFSQVYYKIGLYLTKPAAERITKRAKIADINVFEAALMDQGLQPYVRRLIIEKKAVFDKCRNDRPALVLNRILYGLGYCEYMEKNGLPKNKIGILAAVAEGLMTVDAFLLRLDHLNTLIKTKEEEPEAKVILSTIHSAKGLQYENVMILDAADGIFPEKIPGPRASKDDIAVYEEERRIFYVGITRAKDTLTLLRFSRESRFIDDLTKQAPFLVKKRKK